MSEKLIETLRRSGLATSNMTAEEMARGIEEGSKRIGNDHQIWDAKKNDFQKDKKNITMQDQESLLKTINGFSDSFIEKLSEMNDKIKRNENMINTLREKINLLENQNGQNSKEPTLNELMNSQHNNTTQQTQETGKIQHQEPQNNQQDLPQQPENNQNNFNIRPVSQEQVPGVKINFVSPENTGQNTQSQAQPPQQQGQQQMQQPSPQPMNPDQQNNMPPPPQPQMQQQGQQQMQQPLPPQQNPVNQQQTPPPQTQNNPQNNEQQKKKEHQLEPHLAIDKIFNFAKKVIHY